MGAAPAESLDPALTAWAEYDNRYEWRLDLNRSAEFPPLPEDSGEGRRVVYSNSQQRLWLVDGDGVVVDSYLVSGRRGVPRSGTYRVYSKSPLAYAGHDGVTMTHMVRFARGRHLPIGFHAIPRTRSGRPLQTMAELGQYRSAGCVRQPPEKAEQLYYFADLGTTVVVTP